MRALDSSAWTHRPISARTASTSRSGDALHGRKSPNPEPRPSTPQPSAGPAPSRRHWLRWAVLALGLFLGVLIAFGYFARTAIIERAEHEAIERLAQDGIYLQYQRRTWSLPEGLRLEGVVLHRDVQANHPVVEISAVTIGVPLHEVFKTRNLVSHWSTKDAAITLHDDAGTIVFDHASVYLISRPGELEVPRLKARHGALAFDLSGSILPHAAAQSSPADFILDLSTVRSVLDVLDFAPNAGTFTIRGTWTMDLRGDGDAMWLADLEGAGQQVQWQRIPMEDLKVHGRLSSWAGMDLQSQLQLKSGSAKAALSRRAWDDSPLAVTGTVSDARGATDEFSASYDRLSDIVLVSRLAGKADLLAFARNFPTLAAVLPTIVEVANFPAHTIRDLSWSFTDAAAPKWSVADIQLQSPSSIALRFDKGPIRIELQSGRASFADGTWKGKFKAGTVTWRDLKAQSAEAEGTLAGRRLKSAVELRLVRGAADLTISTDDYQRGNLAFAGSIADSRGRADRFSATYRRDSSTVQVAQLTGNADLLEFATNFPSIPARLPQNIKLRSFPEIAVSNFIWREGKTPIVESLRFLSPANLTVIVKGRPLALDQVTGLASFDGQRWKLARVSGRVFDGQATIDGIYEGDTLRDATIAASNIHVAQLRPWTGESQGSLGDATLALDFRGTLSSTSSRISGAGQVRLENAPIVKVPLLDQTYALFSVLSSPLQRKGSGQLEAKFTASKGVVTVSQFTARSDAARVTATGTVDLNRRQVDGRARGNIRGLFGVVTGPLSRALEMQVSGPLDNIRVRPVGFGGALAGTLKGTAEMVPKTLKHSSQLPVTILRDGVGLPLRALGILKPGSGDETSKRPESSR